ncbi:MAG: PocR ligand-binding domain-containing protein, partial [Clostridiaceae bacterium]|nr:PocR ligand-binding domain-containing protein [Clostridiaceae bacterium]
MESYLYTIVTKEKLQELLEAFNACLKLPIQVLDENGNILERCGEPSVYCRHFIPYL